MKKLYKIRPSSLSGYNSCDCCTWMGMTTGWSAQLALYMSTRITKILENGVDGGRTEYFLPELQAGKVIKTSGLVASHKLPLDSKHDFFLGGEYDHLVEFDDGTYGVVDAKTSAVHYPKNLTAEGMIASYSRQLNAYGYCLENPADQKLLNHYWSCDFSVLGNTKSKRAKVPQDEAKPVEISSLSINSYMVKEGVWKDGGDLTLTTHRVFTEVEKDYDSLLERCQELADIVELDSPPPSSSDCDFCNDYAYNEERR